MARTRTTIRRVDPWSVLKFAFVANLVLLGVYLLVGSVAWMFIRRLELIETVCGLAQSVGYQECAVDGQALFDTVLVLGLLGVVIQTGVFVFLAFLANLIFDLVGGIAITLDDDRPVGGGRSAANARRGVGSTIGAVRRSTSSSSASSAVSDVTSTLASVGSKIGASASRAVAGVSRAVSGDGDGPSDTSSGSGSPGSRPPSSTTGSRSGSSSQTSRRSASTRSSRPSGPPPPPREAGGDEVDDEPLFG